MSFFGKTDVQGTIYLALALFLAAALMSYHPLDPSLNTLGEEPVRNYCGYIGAFLSDLMYQTFGLTSWLFVIASLKISLSSFAGRKKSNLQVYLTEIVLLCSVCAFAVLLWPDLRFFEGHITTGGMTGEMIIAGLIPLIHSAGAFIVLSTALVCCLIAQSHRPLRFYIQGLMHLMSSAGVKLKTIGLDVFKNLQNKSIELPPVAFSRESEEELHFDEQDVSLLPKEEPLTPAQPAEGHWKQPQHSLLPAVPKNTFRISNQEIRLQTQKLQDKLAQFSITGEMVGVKSGPAVTLFEFRPADSVKVGKITQLADDLSMALSAESLRIIAPIPGRDVVGIEASNSSREMVYFKDLVKDPFMNQSWDLPLVMGRHVEGSICVQELSQIPHLLVAGSTGSGKSVFITSLLAGLLMHHSPETLRLILIDPKQVDLSSFADIPHLLFPPITNTSKALDTLLWTIQEMNKRYRSLNQFNVKGIKSFNYAVSKLSSEEKSHHEEVMMNETEDYHFEPLPYICVIVEEFGDLMASPKRSQVEQAVVRLAQMARACGIHLILAMQSPRKDVITGLIKTNIPGRISFKVSSKIDSRVILDESGAERLLSKGDMLFLTPGSAKTKRCHGPFISEEDLNYIVNHWKSQGGPQYQTIEKFENENFDIHNSWNESDEDMEKYIEIRSYVASLKTVSTSSLQRKFRLGYPRAARMMEKFEEEGIVGPAQGSKPREVLHHK